MAATPAARIVLGRILGPHGVRGWLRVQLFANSPEQLLRSRTWRLRMPDGTESVQRLRGSEWDGRWLRVAFEQVENRTAAETFRGAELQVERAALPPTAAREYYCEDLLGFEVRNTEGALLGTVQHFVATPGNDVMVVRGSQEHWVPVTPQHLRRVRLAEREIEVDWPVEL
ncbi:MAG: ribosome maturation factor RimM [Steroidobacterales bacterium]